MSAAEIRILCGLEKKYISRQDNNGRIRMKLDGLLTEGKMRKNYLRWFE